MAEVPSTATKTMPQTAAPETTRDGFHYTPRVDIYETENEIMVECDMPGVKPEDVELRLDHGELTLMGKTHPRRPRADYLAMEYGVGDFYRVFTIPTEVDAAKISAECRSGVLAVRLPKLEKVKPRRIMVQAG